MFDLLTEAEIDESCFRLQKAWDAPSSFLLSPSPSPISPEWLAERLSLLPPDLETGHFGILTSGSTGQPKIVIGSKARTALLAHEIHLRQKLDSVEAAVLALPLAYSYSLVNQWLWSHVFRRKLVKTRGLADAPRLIETLEATASSMLCMVGSMLPVFRRFLSADRTFPEVRCLNFAGGPFPQAELIWLHNLFPSALIFHNYGCTEALPRLTIRPAEETNDPAELGAPVRGAEFKVDSSGMLRFRSPFSAVAIIDEFGARRITPEDWINTGDLAEILPNGAVRLLGRKSEVFKRHGEKISLTSLAESIRKTWVEDFAFYVETAADAELGYVLVLAPSVTKESIREILLLLRKQYRRPFWPIRIETVDRIPLLKNGKPDIQTLKEMPQDLLWKQML